MTIRRVCVVLAACTALAGCAAMRRAAARQEFIHEKVSGYTYNRPLTEVWPMARQLLFEAGYDVRDTGEGGFTLETDWKKVDDEEQRYLAQGVKLDGSSSRVMFTLATKDGSSRDLEMEWRLLQQVDPAASADIERQADEQASTR